ncbi:hypothetical protein LIA77_03356 [Sarocladium implicatum]|nr:hypothetical protein LIA77_03356 [Sarocladium implicatum]
MTRTGEKVESGSETGVNGGERGDQPIQWQPRVSKSGRNGWKRLRRIVHIEPARDTRSWGGSLWAKAKRASQLISCISGLAMLGTAERLHHFDQARAVIREYQHSGFVYRGHGASTLRPINSCRSTDTRHKPGSTRGQSQRRTPAVANVSRR